MKQRCGFLLGNEQCMFYCKIKLTIPKLSARGDTKENTQPVFCNSNTDLG
jgi:hypothetical protein